MEALEVCDSSSAISLISEEAHRVSAQVHGMQRVVPFVSHKPSILNPRAVFVDGPFRSSKVAQHASGPEAAAGLELS